VATATATEGRAAAMDSRARSMPGTSGSNTGTQKPSGWDHAADGTRIACHFNVEASSASSGQAPYPGASAVKLSVSNPDLLRRVIAHSLVRSASASNVKSSSKSARALMPSCRLPSARRPASSSPTSPVGSAPATSLGWLRQYSAHATAAVEAVYNVQSVGHRPSRRTKRGSGGEPSGGSQTCR